jgi:hypothetical protein
MLRRVKAVAHRRARHLGACLLALQIGCRDGCGDVSRVAHRDARATSSRSRGDDAAQRAPTGWRVEVVPASVRGALAAATVEQAMRSHDRALEACARASPMPDVDRVQLMLMFTIGGDGTVADVAPIRPRPESRAIRGCVLQLIRTWAFPRSAADPTQVSVMVEFVSGAV